MPRSGVLMAERPDGGPARPWAEVGARLKAMRDALGLTQEAVSRRTGISETQISVVETGYQRPSRAHLELYAPVYRVRLSVLLELARYPVGDGPPREGPPDTLLDVREVLIRDRRVPPDGVRAVEVILRALIRDPEGGA